MRIVGLIALTLSVAWATPASADRLVTALVAAEVGETVAHESGYRFRVEWIAKDRP